MAEEGVVVEIDLGVEAEKLAAFGDDQRIDLEKAYVLADDGAMQRADEGDTILDLAAREAEPEGKAASDMRRIAGGRIAVAFS